VREILEDRKLLLGISALPGPDFELLSRIFLIETNISWKNCDNIEIDILGSYPSEKILVIGSCKRSFDKHNEECLLTHSENFLKTLSQGGFKGVAERLQLKDFNLEQWKIRYLHFSTTKSDVNGRRHYYFSLMDLLEPFFS
jgi:hypothetical protein